MRLRSFRRRMASVTALALGALLSSSGVVFADSETGQTGHYMFREAPGGEGVVCVYSGSGNFRLTKLIVKPPSLWWPDTDANNNRQRGRVGYRAFVQVSLPGAYGPWQPLKKTTIQKSTAYEDTPDYDMADRAPLTKRQVAFDPSPYGPESNAHVRVVYKAFWYRPNGSVAGTFTHEQFYYEWRNAGASTGSTTACPIRMN